MSGSPARKPARLSGSGGHQNAAFEPDTYLEPVMIDNQPRQTKIFQAETLQNGGIYNAGFQSDDPAILPVSHGNAGYIGQNNTHICQDLKPIGDSNSKPTQKNGHTTRSNDYMYRGASNSTHASGVETGQEVHDYYYPDFPVYNISGNMNTDGINRQDSYAFKGQTEEERNRKENGKHSSHCSRICAVLLAVLILIIIGAIIYVVFEFVVNKPEDVTTTQPLPTRATPSAQMYLVTTSAVASLNLVYSPALADPNTSEYQELEANFTSSMDTAFQNAQMPGVTYEAIVVNSFSSGSVLVNFEVMATYTQNTPPGQTAEESAKNAVETEVSAVLTQLTEDSSSDLPLTSFNVTGSEAEIILPSTPEPTTPQQPTVETDPPSTTVMPSTQTMLISTATSSVTDTTVVETVTTMTTATPSSAQTTPVTMTTHSVSTALVTSDTPSSSTKATSIRTTTPSVTETVITTDTPMTTATPSSAQTTPIATTTPSNSTFPSSACQPNESPCFDGVGCVGFDEFCDGIEQCPDGSDELSCSASCPELTCNDGQCYPFSGSCDGNADCTDGSDEQFCPGNGCDELTCYDGQCYAYNGSCDGNADCADGSDELFCPGTDCDELTCYDGQCYPLSGSCDGNADCADGSDELFCPTCESNEVPCLDGSGCYVFPDEHCDGIPQCENGEDEIYCPGVCSEGKLACATGDQCYNATYQCDGYQDCSDQSDEQNCTSELIVVNLADVTGPYILSSPNYPDRYPLNANLSWLFIAASGNRPRVDISDLYTEPNRDVLSLYSASSPTGQALMLSGAMTRSGIISYRSTNQYLYATFTSDNAVSVRGFYAGVTQESPTATLCTSSQYDCNDGVVCMATDKTCSCPVPPSDCNAPTDCFSCDSGKCIPFEEECDGQQQCEFGEDERNCMLRCNSFLCNDGICMANSTVCDNINDCTGGEDESDCSYPVGEETVDLFYGDIPYPLTSYGYPAEYPNNVDYSWILIAGAGFKIRLQFEFFSTHDANDYITIGDGDVIGTDPFLRLYGGGFVPEEILSQGGDIWVTMVTDRDFNSIGFLANATAVLNTEVLGACAPSAVQCGDYVCIPAERLCDVTPHCVLPSFNPGCPARIDLAGSSQQYQSVTSPFLTLYSANYPARYDNDINATVYLTAPTRQHILAATRKFDTEENYDFLAFYEGHSTSSSDLIAEISGLVPNQIYMSTGNTMTIVFQSDYAYTFSGFWIEVEGQAADGCGSGEFACRNGQCRPESQVCDGEIDCIDFSDEDKCPTCQAVPSQCSSILPWSTTVFPNARYQSETEALQRYVELESVAQSCSPSAGKLLLCAALFPECPHHGTTRNLCPSVCDAVIAGCPALSEMSDACSGSTVVDNNNGNPICAARNGDSFGTGVCGTRPAYQGDAEVQPRIIGGTFAEMGEFPWIGSLRTRQGDLQCGATLLNEHWAITAAHCTGFYDEIVFGDLQIDTPSSYSVSPTIAETIDHPNYFSTSEGDDITLIRFSEPVVFNNYVRPICLPTKTNVSETQMYRRCYAAGWGTLEFEGYASNDLLKVLLGLLENDACGKSYDDIIPSKICAGYPTGGYDACQGDSGGPLACEGDDGRWHLVGITSYGNLGCGDPGFPGVYTRVSSFLDFIEENTGP